MRFDFGIDRYFVPEGSSEPPRDAQTTMVLRIMSNETPRIHGLEVNGRPWDPSVQRSSVWAPDVF